MSPAKPALVLHLVGASQPLHVALTSDEAEALESQLAELMTSGQTRALTTADGRSFAVNFSHVATAHVEENRSDAHAYGATSRGTGFGS